MKAQTKNCQNCKKDFVIETEDFNFYEKIKVPPPTWCPECRMTRRFAWRNEINLYKRKSSLSGEEIISQYSKDVVFPVFSVKEYYSREWDIPFVDYSFDKGFFEQFFALQQITPHCALLTDLQSMENGSIYQNSASRNKNCYMVSASGDNEDSLYGNNLDYSKNSIDCFWCRRTNYSYESTDSVDCNMIFFSEECKQCVDCWFCFECRNCVNCFGCAELRNKSYCFFNEQLSQEDYSKKIQDFFENLTREKIGEIKDKFKKFSNTFPRKYAHVDSNSNYTSSGDYIINSKNVVRGFFIHDSENVRYCSKIIKGSDCWDTSDWGDPIELCYESITIGKGANKIFFSNNCWPECREIQYCDSCSSSHHLFGCIGLKNKSYCILNKQYAKEEYEELVPKIIQHMNDMPHIDSKGRVYKYGEFFPVELSPFFYNETIAQDYFSLSKNQALFCGFGWKEEEEKNYTIDIKKGQIPTIIDQVNEDIINKVLECEHEGNCNEKCTKAFRIVEAEFRFYKKMNLPLPHLCPNCRHYQRLKQRNPLKLWHRQCMCEKEEHGHRGRCPIEFETSYAPERPEIVYCEKCYQKEVY